MNTQLEGNICTRPQLIQQLGHNTLSQIITQANELVTEELQPYGPDTYKQYANIIINESRTLTRYEEDLQSVLGIGTHIILRGNYIFHTTTPPKNAKEDEAFRIKLENLLCSILLKEIPLPQTKKSNTTGKGIIQMANDPYIPLELVEDIKQAATNINTNTLFVHTGYYSNPKLRYVDIMIISH